MNGLKALKHIKEDDFPVMVATYPPKPATLEGYTKDELFSVIEEELKAGEKHKKAIEIIKKSISDKMSLDTLLRELLFNGKINQDEFFLLREVLKQ